MSPSCTVDEILSLVSLNLRRSRDTSHIHLGGNMLYMMRAVVLLYIYQHTKYKVPSYTDSTDMIGVKVKNGSSDFDHAH